jgi:hypothetical protein
MDAKNRFHTKETWLWVRVEQCGLVFTLSALALAHASEVRWGRFVTAFVLIDLIGYIPGAIAYRRASGGKVAPIYHHLYNLTHSYVTAAAVAALWTLLWGGPEWAMLALPIHLAGDRGVFGNVYKPLSLPFEPAAPVSTAPRGDAGVAVEVSR